MPSGESPLLLPQNEHKRLVVIDFEYANANPPGYEFANHFTEWCYNYHAERVPYGCNTKAYPTRDEQARFLAAYVAHRPPRDAAAPHTPACLQGPAYQALDAPLLPPASSLSSFMADARAAPPGLHASASAPALAGGAPPREFVTPDEAVRRRAGDEDVRREVEELRREARRWRPACSALWVMWGVMQAKIAGSPGSEQEEGRRGGGAAEERPLGELKLPDSGFVEGDGEGVGAKDDGRVERVGWDFGTDQRSPEIEAMAESARDKRPEDVDDAENEFDYLGYSRERALFFWGDVVLLGLVKREDLPEGLRDEIRIVDY